MAVHFLDRLRWPMMAVLLVTLGCGGGTSSNPAVSNPPIPDGSPVLLFTGTGTSAPDVAALKTILNNLNLTYTSADTAALNAMTEAQLRSHKLLIVPGGNSIDIGTNLSAGTTANIRGAVGNGLNYLGVCAGAFFGGYSIYNGVDLTSGVFFDFFADENKGIHKEAVTLSFSAGPPLDMYWQDGPQLSGWGNVVARFPDGTPAIAEGMYGKGFVMFTGIHAEAPADWRSGMNFNTPLDADLAYAGTLIQSTLDGTPLPHY